MVIEVRCAQCAKHYSAPETLAGKSVQCPSCGAMVAVAPEGQLQPLVSPLESLLAEELSAPAAPEQSAPLAQQRKKPAKKRREPRKRPEYVYRLPWGAAWLGRFIAALGILVIVGSGIVSITLGLLNEQYYLAIYTLVITTGVVIAFLWNCMVIATGFHESIFCGMMCCFMPFYNVYYALTRWDECQQALTLGMLAISVIGVTNYAMRKLCPGIFPAQPPAAQEAMNMPRPPSRADYVRPHNPLTLPSNPQPPAPYAPQNNSHVGRMPSPQRPLPSAPRTPSVPHTPSAPPKAAAPPQIPTTSFRDEVADAYFHWITADDQEIIDQIRWFAAAKRPAMALRWGVGLYVAQAPVRKEFSSVAPFAALTGPFGPMLLGEMVARYDGEQFGPWPPLANTRLSKIPVFSSPSEELWMPDSLQGNLDMLVGISLTMDRVGLNKMLRTTMRVRLYDVLNRKLLWTSAALNNQKAAATRGTAQDASAELVRDVLKQIDQRCALEPMPTLSQQSVKDRAATLSSHRAPELALRALLELRYYEAGGLMSAEEVKAAMVAIAGEELGKSLSDGSAKQRADALRKWFHPIKK